jgi:hypothetical protein
MTVQLAGRFVSGDVILVADANDLKHGARL